MSNKKVLLVYSGGLDTSICIPLMREEYHYDEVITVTVDVGQSKDDILQAAEKAKILGTKHFTVDAKEEFINEFCWPSLKANGEYQRNRAGGRRFYQLFIARSAFMVGGY